tara:strand:+ start:369 stop:839 length:471 start_codon:yes stop_codon:yes gene_type:complete
MMKKRSTMHKILVLNGPNLNLLGLREPKIYGHETLENLNKNLYDLGKQLGLELTFIQANAEHLLVEAIQQTLMDKTNFIIMNPAAFTHTSIALRDAIATVNIPFIEVHITNIYSREIFRQHSYFSDLAMAVISGLGTQGYIYALRAAHQYFAQESH